jgi:hypothetical protein
VHALYSNGKGVLKHLIILSSGPARLTRNQITLEQVDTLVRDLTVDCENASWTDVDPQLVKSKSLSDTLVQMGSFRVPQFRPYSLLLDVSSQSKAFSFPISSDQESFSIIAKAEGPWDPQLTWTGYDRTGSPMKKITASASVYQRATDTGLVKLWAANNERLNDKREENIGKTYGVVSELYNLKIYPSYRVYSDALGVFAAVETVYVSTRKVPVEGRSGKITGADAKQASCSWVKGGLRVVLPGNTIVRRIKIYALSGKLLLDVDPARFPGRDGCFIPASSLPRSLFQRMVVIVRIEAAQRTWSMRLP